MRISFHSARVFPLTRHADRLFAGCGLVGAVLLAHAGVGQPHKNWLLTISGILSFCAEIWLLYQGGIARRICGPLFIVASLLLLASGLGVFGWFQPSLGEAFTGALTTTGAVCVFYRMPAAWQRHITGPQLGSICYNASCLPLLWAGITGHNTSEVIAAVVYAIGDVAIAFRKPNEA